MLTEVSNGAPPANSPPVSVIAVPGSAYHYSGGSYEIVEALMQDATGKPFPRLMQDLLLDPIGMTASSFEQPPSAALASRAASGHFSDGAALPGRWHFSPSMPRRDSGRRRPTWPNSLCSLPIPGRA
jgi:CubicO group peptidase (beta-lactamase class C family)